MFKKPIEAKALQRLSGADKKKLRRTVKERFPNASDADVDEILPPKADITVAKYPNRVHVYGVEGGFPVVFDVDGRGTEIYPTVFALWKAPELLPAFLLKGGEVSRYVIGGADLMFPGISIPPEGLPSFLAGEPWAVKVPGNSAPIAVGVTTMSSEGAIKAGLRGKALRITHYYQDSLWQSVEGHFVPNAGFLEDVVIEDPEFISQLSDALQEASVEIGESNTVEEGNPAGNVDGYIGVDDKGSVEKDAAKEKGVEVEKDDVVETLEEITANTSGLKISEGASAEVSKNEEHNSLSTEEVDALLDNCLLQTLYTSVKDKDLPMPASTLWSNHILPCRPPDVTLDIKRSSHKKLSKWLQSKSSTGLISAKEDKYKKEVMLLSVNRGHADYIAFKPTKRVQENVEQKHDISIGEGVKGKMQLEISEVYKSSTHVNPIFSAVGADNGKYYSAPEAIEIVFRYVEKENLVKPTDRAVVILDAILCDALFKGTIKKGFTYPTEIHKKDLGPTFLNRMQVHHRVSKGNEVAMRKGAVKPIQIMAERRQGNKKVTRVSGIESFLLDADSLSSELQKKFACSTSVAELPGKKGQYEVLVQGGVIDDLARHLVDHYGVPKRFIEVLDKTRK